MKRISAALATAALVSTACSHNAMGPGNFDQLLNQDVATIAADAAGRDVEMMRGPGGRFGFGFRADPGKFDCTSMTHEGETVTRTCTYKDAAGNTQTAYDSLTTASVNVHATVTGTVDRGHWSGTVNDVRDFTVSGLTGHETTLIWNGTGSGASSRVKESQDGAARQFDLTHSETVTNLVIPVPRTSTSWPLSGTIVRSETIKITGGTDFNTTKQRDATITFDGTQFATVTINGETFKVDLAQRGRAKRSR